MFWQMLEALASLAKAAYTEIKLFFGTPLFFILLGCGFLFAAWRLMQETHPSFVFLLAILGLSIVLYGTGTQGVGSAEFKDVPVKVAVAGGAGVLAGVFGFGVLWQSAKIGDVFKTTHQYGLVVLSNKTDNLLDLTTLHIAAKSPDGRQLHLLAKSDTIEIVTPIAYFSDKLRVCIELKTATGKPVTGQNPCPPLKWTKVEVGEYGEQVSQVATGDLPLTAAQPTRTDDRNRAVEQTAFSPQ